MVVTRAMANSSKNHALLMCRIWKMSWNFFHHWISEKIPFLYFFLHKSWIWQNLGHVTKKFSYRHFHNASKECFWPKFFLNFMHGFKSAILAKMKNCQPIFQILHIKSAWFLLELVMALVTTIGMGFLQVCFPSQSSDEKSRNGNVFSQSLLSFFQIHTFP